MQRQDMSAGFLSDMEAWVANALLIEYIISSPVCKSPETLRHLLNICILRHMDINSSREELHWFRLWGPRWTGPGLRSLTPCFSFEATISATLQSLFSIKKRNARARKVEAEREGGQHTLSERERRRAETLKTKWLSFAQQWKARGPLFFPHSLLSLHF